MLRGDVMIAFARYLHVDYGLLASTVLEYLVHVCTAHTALGLESPGRGPNYKRVIKRLEVDAAACPDRAYCITASMVRMMGSCDEDQDDADWFQVAIYMLFTGGRPIEVLGDDKKSASDPRRADWRSTSWHASNGDLVDPFDPDMSYMLTGLQRKGDRLQIQTIPVFRTGEPCFCAALQMGSRWHNQGQPASGAIFGVAPSGKKIRQYNFRDFLHRFEAQFGFPRLVPYGLRRATATYLNISGIGANLQMDFMGHKHPGTATHKRYVDPPPEPFKGFAAMIAVVRLTSYTRR